MRSIRIFPLTLTLLASISPALSQSSSSIPDAIEYLLPSCVHACAHEVLERMTDCDLDDSQCVCASDITTYNLLNEWLQCPGPGSGCDEDEVQQMMIGPEDINRQFVGACEGVDTDSGDGGGSGNGSSDGIDDDTSNASDSSSGNTSGSTDDEDQNQDQNDEAPEDAASSLIPLNGLSLFAIGAVIIAAAI